MAWIITTDYSDYDNNNAEGRHSKDWVEGMALPLYFRLLDDDGEVYYLGRMSRDCGLEPLWDFGSPNAGATSMQWRTKLGSWADM